MLVVNIFTTINESIFRIIFFYHISHALDRPNLTDQISTCAQKITQTQPKIWLHFILKSVRFVRDSPPSIPQKSHFVKALATLLQEWGTIKNKRHELKLLPYSIQQLQMFNFLKRTTYESEISLLRGSEYIRITQRFMSKLIHKNKTFVHKIFKKK